MANTPSNATHARLSPSSASRWLACTPSVAFCDDIERADTAATTEGRIAHEVAEQTLRRRWLEAYIPKIDRGAHIDEFAEVEGADMSMLEYAEDYAAYVLERYGELGGEPSKVTLRIETRVDLSSYIDGGFGTADCHLYNDDTLHVIDYKYGKGVPVTAVGNAQMRLYALGILDELEATTTTQIKRVVMTIYQPRIGSITTDEITASELAEWGETVLRPRAAMATEGLGEFAAGGHCVFCPARAKCRTLAMEQLSAEAMQIKAANELSDDELGVVLQRTETLTSWVERVKEYALERALAGNGVRGYKVVAGRARREYVDEEAVASLMLGHGLSEDMIYNRKLIGITDAERLLGKKGCNELLGAQIVKRDGKPTLVPMSDKRQPIDPVSVFDGE